MNQERRKKLQDISTKLETLSAELESIKDDEVEANDAKPEHLQNSDIVDTLQEAQDNIEAATTNIDEAVGA